MKNLKLVAVLGGVLALAVGVTVVLVWRSSSIEDPRAEEGRNLLAGTWRASTVLMKELPDNREHPELSKLPYVYGDAYRETRIFYLDGRLLLKRGLAERTFKLRGSYRVTDFFEPRDNKKLVLWVEITYRAEPTRSTRIVFEADNVMRFRDLRGFWIVFKRE